MKTNPTAEMDAEFVVVFRLKLYISNYFWSSIHGSVNFYDLQCESSNSHLRLNSQSFVV